MSFTNPNTSGKSEFTPEEPRTQLDLRGTPCPINFIRAKLRLEQMPPGALLEVWLDGGEPVEQVPDSLKMEGYRVESLTDSQDFFTLLVRRPVSL